MTRPIHCKDRRRNQVHCIEDGENGSAPPRVRALANGADKPARKAAARNWPPVDPGNSFVLFIEDLNLEVYSRSAVGVPITVNIDDSLACDRTEVSFCVLRAMFSGANFDCSSQFAERASSSMTIDGIFSRREDLRHASRHLVAVAPGSGVKTAMKRTAACIRSFKAQLLRTMNRVPSIPPAVLPMETIATSIPMSPWALGCRECRRALRRRWPVACGAMACGARCGGLLVC